MGPGGESNGMVQAQIILILLVGAGARLLTFLDFLDPFVSELLLLVDYILNILS